MNESLRFFHPRRSSCSSWAASTITPS